MAQLMEIKSLVSVVARAINKVLEHTTDTKIIANVHVAMSSLDMIAEVCDSTPVVTLRGGDTIVQTEHDMLHRFFTEMGAIVTRPDGTQYTKVMIGESGVIVPVAEEKKETPTDQETSPRVESRGVAADHLPKTKKPHATEHTSKQNKPQPQTQTHEHANKPQTQDVRHEPTKKPKESIPKVPSGAALHRGNPVRPPSPRHENELVEPYDEYAPEQEAEFEEPRNHYQPQEDEEYYDVEPDRPRTHVPITYSQALRPPVPLVGKGEHVDPTTQRGYQLKDEEFVPLSVAVTMDPPPQEESPTSNQKYIRNFDNRQQFRKFINTDDIFGLSNPQIMEEYKKMFRVRPPIRSFVPQQ